MEGFTKLYGTNGVISLEGYRLPEDRAWLYDMLEVVHTDIPSSHDLLIPILLMQSAESLRSASSIAIASVLGDYESTLGSQDKLRARTFFVAAVTELKMLLDALGKLPHEEVEKVDLTTIEYLGITASGIETSFESMEEVFLLSHPTISRYWLTLKVV
ncbi:hypothetical protein [Pseudomonas sp. 2FE]|uniref:hypothetical protein n=1 Tax=Pseudomonas sp. 2FE TaxID=2502190 RepID=UPI0010F46EC3|nr:hypothetical protein [Pseudomonas sp. 2FE]